MQMVKALPTGPFLIAVPATALIVALASIGLHLGATGVIVGACLGLAWSVLLGAVTRRLLHHERWHRWLSDGSVFLGSLATGVMLGGGVMYGLLMEAAAAAPVTVLSAMMQPAIPFFIILNTPMELLIVPGALFANWHIERRRRLVVMAAAAYYVMRVWTYLFYVPHRMEMAARPLSPGDVEWFQRMLSADYRPVLVALVQITFTAAALVGAARSPQR